MNPWDVGRRRELAAFSTDSMNRIQSLAFSPDGRMMAIRRQHDVELWLAATREEVEKQLKESQAYRLASLGKLGQ
ncbi:MAG TPA: hypothetical protein VJ464_30360 [Blastocatellia bacterium]|nr:hypothetical protein [Blastocatellia bacterium]